MELVIWHEEGQITEEVVSHNMYINFHKVQVFCYPTFLI
jgi:hypothetical protein